MNREFTLIKRTIVVYKAKSFQIFVMGLIAATLFLRTHIHPISPNDGQEIAGFTFFGLLVILFNGIAEMSMAVGFAKHSFLLSLVARLDAQSVDSWQKALFAPVVTDVDAHQCV